MSNEPKNLQVDDIIRLKEKELMPIKKWVLDWINNNGYQDINTIDWSDVWEILHSYTKYLSAPAALPGGGEEMNEPFGYYFEGHFYKDISGMTFSENSKPIPLYEGDRYEKLEQHFKTLEWSYNALLDEHHKLKAGIK